MKTKGILNLYIENNYKEVPASPSGYSGFRLSAPFLRNAFGALHIPNPRLSIYTLALPQVAIPTHAFHIPALLPGRG